MMSALAASIGWVASDRTAREAALDGEVNRTLDEADARIEEGKWLDARAPAERAARLLAAASRPGFPPRLQDLQKDLAMAQRLEDIYSQAPKLDFFGVLERDAAYARAFRDYGIDLAVLSVAEAAKLLRARGIRLELTRALDYWSTFYRWRIEAAADYGKQSAEAAVKHIQSHPSPSSKKLMDIAKVADPDSWRNLTRDTLMSTAYRDQRWKLAPLAVQLDARRKSLTDLVASADVRQLPPATLTLLGWCLSDTGAHKEACDLLAVAQRMYPDDWQINQALAWQYFKMDPPRYDETVRFLSVAAALRPQNSVLAMQLSRVLKAKGAVSEAIAQTTAAIDRLARTHEEAQSQIVMLKQRALMYEDGGQADKALADIARILELDPKDKEQWLWQGRIYAASTQWAPASASYAKGAESATDERGSVGLEEACLSLLNSDQAGYRRACSQLLNAYDRTPRPRAFFVARAFAMAPQSPEAVRRAEDAGAAELKNNQRFWALTASAGLHYRAGRYQEASELLHQCLKNNPAWDGKVLNWLWLALTNHQMGKKADAREWLDKATQWLDKCSKRIPLATEGIPLHLHDWLEAHVLRREAEALITTKEDRSK
jgi:tetratricopeptide (TPR) repeat protein